MTPGTTRELLFSWLHISDIHFGHGDDAHRSSQRRIVEDLLLDVKKVLGGGQQKSLDSIPRPEVIFLTGDIAFKGDEAEYSQADIWLSRLVREIGLERRKVFVIPGNHDVQRTREIDRQAYRLLESLRSGREEIDAALKDPIDRHVLTRRFKNYLSFSRKFAPATMNPLCEADQWLFWSHVFQPRRAVNLRVRLSGVNTALLCNDDQDSGKLRVGSLQMLPLFEHMRREGELTFVLTHHPLEELAGADTSSEHVAAITRAHIHLSGHVHSPDSKRIQSGSGNTAVKIVAGAVHGEPGNRDQGYSFGAVIEGADESLEVRVWPRRWLTKPGRFGQDQENTPEGKDFAAFLLDCKIAKSPFADRICVIPSPGLPPQGSSRDLLPEKISWIVDPESARDWLYTMGLDRSELLLPGNIMHEDGAALESSIPEEGNQWRSCAVERMCSTARKASSSGLVTIFLHGIRGVGKSTILLRHVASSDSDDLRFVVDCGSYSSHNLEDAHKELAAYLEAISTFPSAREVFIAIDGLDTACRAQALRQREPKAARLLVPHVDAFRRIVADRLSERRVCLVFAMDDPPEWQPAIATTDGWATSSIRPLIQSEFKGMSFRLNPPGSGSEENAVFDFVLPRALDLEGWRQFPFLQLPVFFDALRDADPGHLLSLKTKRQFLRLGSDRAKALRHRQHTYYATLTGIDRFLDALSSMPAMLKEGDKAVEECVALLEPELTGDWMYLFDISREENGFVNRLTQLHEWLSGEGWRYSDSFALSNIVSVLALLGRFKAENAVYSHCNLRNAQLINGASIVKSFFYGVDFSGAKIHSATILDGVFYGVDFAGASIENSKIEGESRFIGCRYDESTFARVEQGKNVKFIESIH
jgi:calcineurin-like phosphoesterase family protein